MVRRTSYDGSTTSITGGVVETLTWTNSDIASERVVAYHVTLLNGSDLGDVTRIRLKANGSDIWNVSPTQLRDFVQSYSLGKLKIGAAATTFTIPLYLMDAPGGAPDLQDVSQFPMDSQVQLEIVMAATAVAGSAYVGWTETSIAPQVFPRVLGSAMNIPLSTTLQRFNFQENGVVRGIGLPLTGIDRVKLVIGAEEFTHLPGEEFLGTAGTPDMALEAESLYGNGVSSAGTPLTTSAFLRVTAGIPAPVQQSFVELQTGAGWGGVANEACIYAVAPQRTAA